MGGATSDELTFSIGISEYFSGPPPVAQTPAEYVAAVTARYGAKAGAVLAEYPLSNYGGNTELAYDRVQDDPIECGVLGTIHGRDSGLRRQRPPPGGIQ